MPKRPTTGILEDWNRTIDTAFESIVGFAELSGETVDHATRRQLRDWNACFLAGTREIRRTLETVHRVMFELPARPRRVALVTGGTAGICTAICQQLAESGHCVVATYIASGEEAAKTWQGARRAEGHDLSIVECDVASFESCRRMAERVESEFGAVDILVNCAGMTGDGSSRTMEQDHWHAVLDANLDGVFNVTRHIIGGMSRRRYGRIINISTVTGQKNGLGQTARSAAKAGMIGFTTSLARELADQGITVNTVSPGSVATGMAFTEENRKGIIGKIGRLGEPAALAQAVAFLAAEESSYVTGTDIAVGGEPFMT